MKLVTVIVAGGSGSRLWPVSRDTLPKPFMRIGELSLFQQAVTRGVATGSEDLVVVTNQDHFYLCIDALQALVKESTETTHAAKYKNLKVSFILETEIRNTAPAISLAALAVSARIGGDAVMLVLPADHLVPNNYQFAEDVSVAVQNANAGQLVTFGITPTTPETGFGYIEVEKAGREVQPAIRFVEKPDFTTAKSYLTTGRYYWNSGIFCFQAGTFLETVKKQSVQVYDSAITVWSNSTSTIEQNFSVTRFDPLLFSDQPNVSIDYAVMEKATNVTLVPASFQWSDVGSWPAVSHAYSADSSGNTYTHERTAAGKDNDEQFIAVETHNTHIHIQSHMPKVVATVGVADLVIVDTPDALLVSSKANAQQVKDVVDNLKKRKHDTTQLPVTVHRPWGNYAALKEEMGYKVKRITVKPGQSLSLQYHHKREEHWVVVQGTGVVQIGDVMYPTQAGQYRFVPLAEKHRLSNTGQDELVLIEVQFGDYLGEDDIVRLADSYGRQIPHEI